jgi:molecular chaperone DnaK (HSP70)
MEITDRTVRTARAKGIEHFDDVLLVGGASRTPVVAEELNRRFGFEPRLHDPDQAVAKGAARFALIEAVKVILLEDAGSVVDDGSGEGEQVAAAREEQLRQLAADHGVDPHRLRRLGEKQVTTVVPRAFGVKVLVPTDEAEPQEPPTWSVAHVLAANDPLPARPDTQTFFTAHAGQTEIEIEIWEQAGAVGSPDLSDNARIGDGLISELPPLPKGSPIDVDFEMDERGLLRVRARELHTGRDLAIEVQIQGLTEEQVEHSRTVVSNYAVSGG